MSGLDRIQDLGHLPEVQGNIGLLCHHASQTSTGRHAVDIFQDLPEVQLSGIFTPEHGFSGRAAPGEQVAHSLHDSGIPIYSLYGETRVPEPSWLSGLDAMVVDLKDLGVRCYTYASTLFEMLHACNRQQVPVVVLDRHTPLQGIIDGPDLEPGAESFVGRIPLPLVFGQSQGALATTLTHLLPSLAHLPLSVVPCMENVPQPWINPSPAIVSETSACCYPVTVWSEAIPHVWVDRGGPNSFQVWAMPDFPREMLEMSSSLGFHLHLDVFETPEGPWPGVRIEVTDPSIMKPVTLAHQLLHHLCNTLGPERLFQQSGARPGFFDQLAGGSHWRIALTQGNTPDFI